MPITKMLKLNTMVHFDLNIMLFRGCCVFFLPKTCYEILFCSVDVIENTCSVARLIDCMVLDTDFITSLTLWRPLHLSLLSRARIHQTILKNILCLGRQDFQIGM